MREKARQILEQLRQSDKALSDAFDLYVDRLATDLEIPKDIAVTLVTDELVNKYERKLILRELFSQSTLESIKK